MCVTQILISFVIELDYSSRRVSRICREKEKKMSPQTSIRRKSRLKMIAGVSVTALLGLGAALLPNGAGHGALAATPSVLLPPLPSFPFPFRSLKILAEPKLLRASIKFNINWNRLKKARPINGNSFFTTPNWLTGIWP